MLLDALAGPPQKRPQSDSGIAPPPWLNGGETVEEFRSYSTCMRHGRLRANLCERCLAGYARHLHSSETLERSNFPGLANAEIQIRSRLSRTTKLVKKHMPAALRLSNALLKASWVVITVIGQITYSCFVCLILMWFVQPSLTPAEQERRNAERARRRREDDAWRERRDADYAARREEQEAWEKQRDEDYRKKVEEYYKWDDERIALAEAAAIAEKMTHSNQSVVNDAWRLDDLKEEIQTPELTKAIEFMEQHAVDERVERACDSIRDAESILDDVRERDTTDGSRRVKFFGALDDAEDQINDADDARKRWRQH